MENNDVSQIGLSARNQLPSVLIFHSRSSMIALSTKIFFTMLEEINLCVIIRYYNSPDCDNINSNVLDNVDVCGSYNKLSI